MSILLMLGPLQLYLVLGRVYLINRDDYQRTCLRIVWRGRPVVRCGHSLAG